MSINETSLKVKGGAEGKSAPLIPLRNLMKQGVTGTLAIGTYEGQFDGKYGPEYRVRGSDDTLYIVPNTAGIREQLDGVLTGTTLKVNYNGQVKTKAGRSFHDFELFVVNT
jgi:hypothetical protein